MNTKPLVTTDATEFLAHLPPMRPIVGMDFGTKTVGLALSDRMWQIATAAYTLQRGKFTKDADEMMAFINKENAGGIVLGWPRNMDGSDGPRAQSTRSFAQNLAQAWGEKCPPILFWDERLSTVVAERAMLDADLSRKKRGEKIDALAAAIIMQGALDRLSVLRRGS